MFQTILKKISSKIKIFKLANILRINPFFFFDLIIFHGSKLFRSNVDDKLIILGGSSGQAFIGNTKYLYFYLRDNTDYKIYYLVKSKELQKKLEDQGIKTLFGYSIKAIRILRKARAVFVTHGFIDVLPIKFSPRTVFVQTWHGSDIKILKRPEYFSKYIYSKWSTLTRVKLRNHHVYDYVLNTSGEKKPLQILANAFNYPMKRILPLGYPRNDILFSEDLQLVKQIKKYYDISNKVSRIMLYAPTFREDFTTKDPFSEEDLIKLNELCKKVNSILILKTHIRDDIINLATLSNIKNIR
ncbi:MAG: CDP-glycerol glycerophosphotransferase family protein, partial [Candidatus Hermodarchaeota archaeon]